MTDFGSSATSSFARRLALLVRRRSWRCRRIKSLVRVSARQERIAGWDQPRLERVRIVLAGAGAIGGEIAEGLVRKGAGELHICDEDIYTPSNLNRQKALPRSLYRNKAVELCRIMSRQGALGTRLVAHPCWLQDLDLGAVKPDVLICAVDNQIPATRAMASRWGLHHGVPVVITGVTPDADGGYVFVQQTSGTDAERRELSFRGRGCWGCALKPEELPASTFAVCPESPASIDIIKTLSGLALYAVDTVVMRRPRDWNYRVVSLHRGEYGGGTLVAPRPSCTLCRGRGGAS
ncbi:MAG: ThiF family adenylyltransferase [Phycisphaerales bacterium]|nr:ThiF family adenylyltransferase [Phycisphaerales bacterium]